MRRAKLGTSIANLNYGGFMSIQTTKLFALALSLVTLLGHLPGAQAQHRGEGGHNGGGTGKPNVSFGAENIQAILKASKVQELLGMNLTITGLQEVSRKIPQHIYRVTADNVVRNSACVFEVEVMNDHGTVSEDVAVTELKVLSGCPTSPKPQATSVLIQFKSYFTKYDAIAFNENRPYREYLAIAKSVSAAERAQITTFMKTSDEQRFAQVFEANATKMRLFLHRNPNATAFEFCDFLGQVMGLDMSRGLVIPVIVGLKFAPLFIVD
jgi:hypothetical protein